MFSGIVENTGHILSIEKINSIIRIVVSKPEEFQDLKIGDSICTNGVCLTIEKFDNQTMQFALGPETLAITKWDDSLTVGSELNLERSLRFGDRIHGHLVSGHVDAIAEVVVVEKNFESLFFAIEIPEKLKKYVWKKGSLCINGVSLTINEVDKNVLSFYLIPETLKKTNLKSIKPKDFVNIEVDTMAKAVVNYQEIRLESHQ